GERRLERPLVLRDDHHGDVHHVALRRRSARQPRTKPTLVLDSCSTCTYGAARCIQSWVRSAARGPRGNSTSGATTPAAAGSGRRTPAASSAPTSTGNGNTIAPWP